MPPKAPVTPGEKAAAKRLQKKVEMASAHSAQAATPSEIETSESVGRPIRQAKEVAMKNQVWAADKPATRKRAASSIADSGKGKQKKLTVGTSIKKQIVPPEESNHGTARPPRLRKTREQDIDLPSLDQQPVDGHGNTASESDHSENDDSEFLSSHDDELQSKKPKQLKDLFYDETPHFVTNTVKAALKPTTHSSKPSGSYITSMIPTSDSDDDQATSTSQTTKAVTRCPYYQERAKKTVHKAAETPHFTAALSTSSIPDSLTRNSTRLEDTWSLLTHLVWNGNNTINLLSQQPHIQVILHAAIQLVERELYLKPHHQRKHKEVLQRLEQDQAYMKALHQSDGRIVLIRKKLKDISDRVVPGAYGVKTGDDEKINRLLNLLTFIYKFDTKGNPILSQPFDHPAINTVCQLAFFTSQDQVGKKYKDRFVSVLDDNDEPEIPSAMVSAVVTAIFSSLLDLKSVVDVGRERGDFGQSLIRMFDNNMEMLNGIYTEGPHVYHSLMARKYKAVSNVVDFASAELKAAFARIDFDVISID
ncbi:uncharacterized protein F5891DRAFT_1282001 [Suillus fuscotomentosus]|uniref:DUF6532 domain-containing protein n=1 Tax=Suillus fuscotomentosus TaxID=1912939 RepID=A0AAD4DTK6_9AGAM|nr:uncharacterized protein F5891DRAFT_1282001 [Suillus fuscotomentosus]KAG1893582.1 hypothetical protein F5891DRAFT_1282001 [Suillus fuscotomentosus]